jgi:hypothetical protein
MQAALDDMLLRRRSIFFGTIFENGSKPSRSRAASS